MPLFEPGELVAYCSPMASQCIQAKYESYKQYSQSYHKYSLPDIAAHACNLNIMRQSQEDQKFEMIFG